MTADKPHSEDAKKSICLRCKRPFTPKKDGQLYGEKCLRKMRGQTVLLDRYLVGPRKRRPKKTTSDVIEIRDKEGEVTAVMI